MAADVDRDHPRVAEVPLQVRLKEGHDEAAAGPVDVHGDVRTAGLGQLVEHRRNLGDRLELTGERRAENGQHADRVLIDRVADLLGGHHVAARLHRQVLGLDIEVLTELLPHHLHVGAQNEVGLGGILALGLALGAPAPLHRQSSQHDRLGGADRRHAGGGRRIGLGQVLGVEQVRHHVDAAGLDLGGRGVLILVDHVLVERLGHQALGLVVHPRRHERRQVQPRVAIEHQLVVDEAVRDLGVVLVLGHAQAGDGLHAQAFGERRLYETRIGCWFTALHCCFSLDNELLMTLGPEPGS